MLLYPNYIAKKRDSALALAAISAKFGRSSNSRGGYVVSDGVAIVPVFGALMKGWGYPDQSELRSLMGELKNDSSVKAVLKVFDSPGGSVAGTSDYGASVRALSDSKPVIAYCEDMCCSAAYWVACSCSKILANSTAFVGSIGVISWLTDASKMYEEMGVKEIPITTGKYKAAGDESQEATLEIVDYMQSKIDDLFTQFVDHVSSGRSISKKAIRDMNAAVFVGQKAVDAGLVDGICSIDDAYGMALRMANKQPSKNKASLLTELEIEMALAEII